MTGERIPPACFASLKISGAASYHVHLNQYDVIKVNMQEFLSMTHDMDDMLGHAAEIPGV